MQSYCINTQSDRLRKILFKYPYTEAVLKFKKLNTQSQQHEEIVQWRSLLPYQLGIEFALSGI
jgi:hypothetical protein